MSPIQINNTHPFKKHYALVTFPNSTKHPGKRYVFGFDAFVGMHSVETWYKLLDEYDIAVQTREDGPMDAQLKDVVVAHCAFDEVDQVMVEAYGATLPIKPILGITYHSKKKSNYKELPLSNYKELPLDKITVPFWFWKSPPATAKFVEHYESFVAASKKRKRFGDPILPGTLKVRQIETGYLLMDGFCTYLLYRAFGWDKAVVEVVNK